MMIADGNLGYEERVTSKATEVLFLALAGLFLLLFMWRLNAGGLDILAVLFFCLFGYFLFCTANYRKLIIRLTSESLRLTFGIFTWTVPLDNIGEFRLDDLPVLMKLGGAGIHFMRIRRRYRVSFNFLEHPRVVIALKRRAGLVRDISFSTRHPDDVLQRIQDAASATGADL